MIRRYVEIVVILCILYAVILCTNATSDVELQKRRGKLFPIFQVVTFPNQACTGNAAKNGTCYTKAECAAKSGVAAGSCANGYGVCCVFTIGCGGTSSQNCTYFDSTGTNSGTCSVSICKCSTNICQFRLDFNTFVITGPTTVTLSVAKVLNALLATSGTSVSAATQCLTDTFTVTNNGGQSPPVICGTNTGQHMYLDPCTDCSTIAFQLGSSGIGTTLATRQWSIKITQYSCDYKNLAPPGCTQYFYGSNSQVVQTYNYQGGEKLANQNMNICVRICWTTVIALTDFSVSSKFPAASLVKQSLCCGYGPSGKKTIGNACVIIRWALSTKQLQPGASRICGSKSGLLALTSGGKVGKTATVCSSTAPFSIRFESDNWEYKTENMAATPKNKGFQLAYIMSSTGCITTTTNNG